MPCLHSDSVTVEGLVPELSYPRIPSHEVIGVIDALGTDVDGSDVDARIEYGRLVIRVAAWTLPARQRFRLQNIHRATGVTRNGGYATRMLALASALAKVPGPWTL